MKTVKLIHNPNAGDGDYGAKELKKLIESKGYKCRYANIKNDDWKEIEPDTDIIAVAGGDGALRKVCQVILQRTNLEKRIPIALLPLGTANNIGNSLEIADIPIEELIDNWAKCCIKRTDVGIISGLEEDELFFVEGFGFGIFPNLMNAMKKVDTKEKETAEDSLNKAMEVLLDTVKNYSPRKCKLVIDGADHSGNFLLVEIMNIPSLGPNMHINPMADMGDGEFEIIVIPEGQRERLQQYVKDKMDGKEPAFAFSALKGRDISITWEGIHAHMDDEILKADKSFKVTIDINTGVLDFIVAANK